MAVVGLAARRASPPAPHHLAATVHLRHRRASPPHRADRCPPQPLKCAGPHPLEHPGQDPSRKEKRGKEECERCGGRIHRGREGGVRGRWEEKGEGIASTVTFENHGRLYIHYC